MLLKGRSKGDNSPDSSFTVSYPVIETSDPPNRRVLHGEAEVLPNLTPRSEQRLAERIEAADPTDGPRHVLHDYYDEEQREVLPYDPLPEPSPVIRRQQLQQNTEGRMIIQKTLNDEPGVHYLEKDISRFPAENSEELFLSEGEQVCFFHRLFPQHIEIMSFVVVTQRICPHCKRCFNPMPYTIHEPICKNVFGKNP